MVSPTIPCEPKTALADWAIAGKNTLGSPVAGEFVRIRIHPGIINIVYHVS